MGQSIIYSPISQLPKLKVMHIILDSNCTYAHAGPIGIAIPISDNNIKMHMDMPYGYVNINGAYIGTIYGSNQQYRPPRASPPAGPLQAAEAKVQARPVYSGFDSSITSHSFDF